MKIRWSPKAIDDLVSIREYIAQRNPSAASRVAARIREVVYRLVDFPLSGRAGRVTGTRELIIPGTPYIAIYRIHEDTVEIAAVPHGQQNYPESC